MAEGAVHHAEIDDEGEYDSDESISPVSMDTELLSLLRCPQTGGILRAATPPELARINGAIRNSTIRNQAGEVISDILNDCLICDSAGLCYPVRDDLPLLIAGEAFGSPR
jgi:uncharacterized protein YbaR (Trm112 family)